MDILNILLDRKYKLEKYTIGKLHIDGKYFCDTIEDKDRGLTQEMSLEEIKKRKVYGETAIPRGTYEVTLKVQSPKYKDRKQYAFCKGYVPRLKNVKGYEGVLIHIGNYAKDSLGCILVGENKVKGAVVNSTVWFKKLYEILRKADEAGKKIFIEIK